jgi:hypothetical protein
MAGSTIYYLCNLGAFTKPPWIFLINLLNEDNDIDFAGFWWGLKLDNKVFNHLSTFLLL